MECMQCDRELAYGDNVVTVTRGIVGSLRVVTLGAAVVFCGDECLAQYYGDRRDDLGES